MTGAELCERLFQSTPPRGGRRRRAAQSPDDQRHFNPRPREGGDCASSSVLVGSSLFQSTPPRGGRRLGQELAVLLIDISIHAPARGATECLLDADVSAYISIHAPARGATQGQDRLPLDDGYFNPRPREGGDGEIGELHGCRFIISIHAPARGATPRTASGGIHPGRFQSTPPRGGRPHTTL